MVTVFDLLIKVLAGMQLGLAKALEWLFKPAGLALLAVAVALGLFLDARLTLVVLALAAAVVFIFFISSFVAMTALGATAMSWDDDSTFRNKYVRRVLLFWFYGVFWIPMYIFLGYVVYLAGEFAYLLLTGDGAAIDEWVRDLNRRDG